MAENFPKKIDQLFTDSITLGTGFIPTERENWWFAVGNKKYWRETTKKKLMISFTAIGGHVEPDETIVEAALREIREETGVDAKLLENPHNPTQLVEAVSTEKTFFDFTILKIHEILLDEIITPWIVYIVKQPNRDLGVAVFQGKFTKEPYPQAEVPALLKLSSDLILECPTPLETLLESGAEIREQKLIPRNAVIYPFGSAKILQYLLRENKL